MIKSCEISDSGSYACNILMDSTSQKTISSEEISLVISGIQKNFKNNEPASFARISSRLFFVKFITIKPSKSADKTVIYLARYYLPSFMNLNLEHFT